MTNLKRASGTLKIVNRKIACDETPGSTGPVVGEPTGLPTESSGPVMPASEQKLSLPLIENAEDLKENVPRNNRLTLEEDGFEEGEDEDGDEHVLAEQEVDHMDKVQESKLRQRLGDRGQQQQQEKLGEDDEKESSKGLNGKQVDPQLGQLDPAEDTTSGATATGASTRTKHTEFKRQLVWRNIWLFVILHSSLPIGAYLAYTQRPWRTLAWSLFGSYLSGLGVTGGAHRLWSHRSYKASWGVELLLMALQTMAGQNSIYTWCRDHRVHHKFSETNADPHNIKRGFFFAHMGWLCCKKHPDVKQKGALIDMSDLEANRLVMFQHRHFWWLAILFTVVVPTAVPVLLWNESIWTSLILSFMVRYLVTLHGTWLVNSAAHYYGSRPYDQRMEARESPMVILTGLGEGFHNYHHTFPYDYSTSEFGKFFNITTAFIDLCAALGLVYDRRKMDRQMIASRKLRTGQVSSKPTLGPLGEEATLAAASSSRPSQAALASTSAALASQA